MIRVAILGAGIGAQHFKAYRALPDLFEVTMLVDRDVQKLKAFRCEGDLKVATDISDALSAHDVDLIDICLPPKLHADVTQAALRAGKHVICEKPVTTSLRQNEAIRQTIEQTGKRVFPVFQYRWGPSHAQLRHLIASGLAGSPQAASLETHWSRGSDYYANGWRGTWEVEQGGAVLCHAIHLHDLVTDFMGPISALSARLATRVNPIQTEDTAAILFELENGALVTSSVCLGAARDTSRIKIIYEHLTVTSGESPYAPGADTWTFEARDPAFQSAIDDCVASAPVEDVGFVGFLKSVAGDLCGKAPHGVTFETGASSIELATAIYHSARTHERVGLPLSPDHPLADGWRP